MSDEATEEASGREREVLRTRRESRERLGDRAFALNLEQALGVPEPDPTSAIREEFGGLEPDTLGEEHRTVAGNPFEIRRDDGAVIPVQRDANDGLQCFVQHAVIGRLFTRPRSTPATE